MARSKRNKIVSLTKTDRKGRNLKSKLVDTLRDTLDEYKAVYLFSFENMRTEKFKEVRMYFRESRIYLGKNTIAQIALGRSAEEEYKCNLSKISEKLVGNVGLLFTNRPRKEVLKYFENFSHPDFAKAGAVATENYVLEPQPLLQFPVSMLNELRKMGMAVEIDDGTVVLREPVTVMTADVALTPEQARMLVKLDRKTITFRIRVECMWLEKGSKFIEFPPAI